MKHIKKLSTIATATGLGALLATGMTGCSQNTNQYEEQQQAQGAFIIIEETAPGKYKIKDEFPADETRIVLKKLDGTEKVLTKPELDALIKEEAAKVDNGTSNLTQEQSPQAQQQGMGLGETIMASMAGAMLGAWIGNKLFGNQNYQNNRKAGYKSPSTYSKSKNSFNKSNKSSSSKKSGFFGNKKSSSKSGGSFGG
ncbi:MAG: FIG01388762: membrane lipoprotein [uncultured Sulfurovum sp.]|uniref:FIG01388762: membrane lipoprotein n=1 Tax=uncultured Sulfurovum sp. TaxID=269237 RepID=A0A6S6U255_9BACT|nr:MAG: FIG01388762: membrane lipoprotein [uncultured Sulfurovum sp.]